MKKLHLSENLAIPIDAVTQRISILGRTGTGKSYTAGVLVEEVLKASQQVVVLDPKGDWYGLRSSADGKSAGLPITIMGGEHGDVPLEPTAGALVADVVVNEGISVVIDLSLFESKAAEIRFAEAFADRLYRKNRKPMLLVVDEADIFAPQRPEKNETTMLNRMETLCRRGRSKGIGVVLVSQRSASLHKGCLSQTELMIAHQTTAPQDKKAIELWVSGKGDEAQQKLFIEAIASLGTGTASVWSPSWLNIFRMVKVRHKETYDSSQTPKVGVRRRAPKVLAKVDLERLKAHMAATIEKMKQEDPKLLRLEIKRLYARLENPPPAPGTINVAALRQELENWKKKAHVAVLPPKPKIVTKRIIVERDITRLHRALNQLEKLRVKVNQAVGKIDFPHHDIMVKLGQVIDQQNEEPKPDYISQTLRKLKANGGKVMGIPVNKFHVLKNRPTPTIKLSQIPAGPAPDFGDDKPLKGERDIMESLLVFYPKPLNKDQLGVYKGIKPKGTTLSTYLNRLRRRDWIKIPNGYGWELTATGHTVATNLFPNVEPLTTEQILELWRKRLLAGEREILDKAVQVFPDRISLQSISESMGIKHTGTTMNTYVNRLRRNCLIEVETHGESKLITASKDLFQVVNS